MRVAIRAKRGLRGEQVKEVDRARQPRDELVEACQRRVGIGRCAQCLDQFGQHRFERVERRRTAQRAQFAAAPFGDRCERRVGRIEPRRQQLHRQPVVVARQAGSHRAFGNNPVVAGTDIGGDGFEHRQQRRAVGLAIEPRDAVERGGLGRQAMRLLVLDHLQAMFDPAQRRIMARQARRDLGLDPPRRGERRQRIDRRRNAQRRIAPAIDQLVDLREKFDLADAAAPALQVIARPERLALRKMIADPVAHRADFLELAEIEAAAPDEGLDRRQELFAERAVARRGARADERRLLPRQRFGFIIGNGRVHRQHDRGDLGMRAQPQVDAQDMAVAGAR